MGFGSGREIGQFRLLDTYVSFNLLSNEFSVGKQSYWWSPDESTALLIGNQGLPFDSKRIDSLLRLGGSSKERTEEHHTIGYKGIGFSSVFEVTDEPHRGCKKFAARFGRDALQFVNSATGRELNLRGVNAKVVVPGTVRVGDVVNKLPA